MTIILLLMSILMPQAEAAQNCNKLQKSIEMERFLFKDCMLKTLDKAGKGQRPLAPLARRCAAKVKIAAPIKRHIKKCDYSCPPKSFGYEFRRDNVDVCRAILKDPKIQKEAKIHAAKKAKKQKLAQEKKLSIDLSKPTFQGGLIGAKGPQKGSAGLGKGPSNRKCASHTTKKRKKNTRLKLGGNPVLLGSLNKNLINKVIKKHLRQFEFCFQREFVKNRRLAGKLTVKFVIGANGAVSKASISKSTLCSPAVESCMKSRFRTLKFPKPKGGGIVMVNYPFVF